MTFDAALDEAIGTRGDVGVCLKNLWFYDFDGYPIRMWNGEGRLFAGGQEWLGTQVLMSDGTLIDVHKTPSISDGRDLTSPLLSFTLGLIDAVAYEALRLEKWRIHERTLTHYECLMLPDEGLRPSTPLNLVALLELFGSGAFEEKQMFDGRTFVRSRQISVQAKDDNYGRSLVPGRTFTDEGQKAHAAFYGVAVDKGGERIAQNANRIYKIG